MPKRKLIEKRKQQLFSGDFLVFHRCGRGKQSPRYLVKCCGGYHNKLGIYYGEDSLEIGGVHGSLDSWRKLLLPLLLTEDEENKLKKGK